MAGGRPAACANLRDNLTISIDSLPLRSPFAAQSTGIIFCSVTGDYLPDLVGGKRVWPERLGTKV